MSVTEAAVEIATRIFCHGIPMDIDPRSMTLAGLIAKGRCMAPDCKCWEPGKEVARAALTAAASARWRPIEVVELQPDADCPGLWIGFRTAEQREQAMKLFALPSPPETER